MKRVATSLILATVLAGVAGTGAHAAPSGPNTGYTYPTCNGQATTFTFNTKGAENAPAYLTPPFMNGRPVIPLTITVGGQTIYERGQASSVLPATMTCTLNGATATFFVP